MPGDWPNFASEFGTVWLITTAFQITRANARQMRQEQAYLLSGAALRHETKKLNRWPRGGLPFPTSGKQASRFRIQWARLRVHLYFAHSFSLTFCLTVVFRLLNARGSH